MIGLGYKTEKDTRIKEVSEKESQTEINQELGKENSDDSEKDPIELHEIFYKFFWKAKPIISPANCSRVMPVIESISELHSKPLLLS